MALYGMDNLVILILLSLKKMTTGGFQSQEIGDQSFYMTVSKAVAPDVCTSSFQEESCDLLFVLEWAGKRRYLQASHSLGRIAATFNCVQN